MADILYTMQFKDYSGINCTVYIRKPGATVTNTDIEGGPAPCIVKMLANGDDKFVHIKATECTLQLISSSSLQYLAFFTDPVKTYKVEVYRGIDPIWEGWVNPDNYSEPFTCGEYITNITCTDGIAELKNVPLPLPGYTAADFKKTIIYYVDSCITQIGLDPAMIIKVAVNIGCIAGGATKTKRIFEELFIDYRTFRSGGKFISCYEVLDKILKTFNARLFQYVGCWHIERIDQKHDDYPVENYTGGAYTSTDTYNAVTSLTAHVGAGTDIRFQNGATLEIQPAYKEFKVVQDYGQRFNILPFSNYEGEFNDEDFINSATLRYWDATQGLETALIAQTTFQNSQVLNMKAIPYAIGQVPSFTAYIEPFEFGVPPSSFIYISNEGSTNEEEFKDWIFGQGSWHLKMKIFANQAPFFESSPKLRSFIAVHINFSGRIYRLWSGNGITQDYDLTKYEWVSVAGSPTTYDMNHFTVELPKSEWFEFDVNLNFPPAELGHIQTYVGFLIQISSPNLNQATMSVGGGILYKDIQLYFSDDRDEEKTMTVNTVIDLKNILTPADYEVNFGDTPAPYDDDGCGLVNKYVLFDSAGGVVNHFGIISGTPPYVLSASLIRTVLKTDLEVTYLHPLAKLKGTLIDTTLQSGVATGLDFRTCLKDYDKRYYIITGLAYNLKDSTFEGEWLQMWDESGG